MNAVPMPASQRLARSHRTPRYVYHRTRQLFYERAHPADPWLTPAAIGLLATLLRPADTGAEFGSGRSTLWFAARVAELGPATDVWAEVWRELAGWRTIWTDRKSVV